jgi:hypothetical protein
VAVAGAIVAGTTLMAGAQGATVNRSTGPFGATAGQIVKLGISNYGDPDQLVASLALVDEDGAAVAAGRAEIAPGDTAFLTYRVPSGRMELRAMVGWGNPEDFNGSAMSVQVINAQGMRTAYVVETFWGNPDQ